MTPRFDERLDEFELRSADGVLEAVMRETSDCIQVVDLDGRIVRWSGACEALYGWSAAEVLGETAPHVPESARIGFVADLRSTAAGGEVERRNLDMIKADGSRAAMRLTLIPMTGADEAVTGILAITHEVFGDERPDRRRSDFATLVGEGISGPLHSITAAAALLQHPEVTGDASRRTQLAAIIAERAATASSIADDLLLASRLGAGSLRLERRSHDLREIVTQSAAALDPRGDRIVLEMDGVLGNASVDAELIGRAVSILLRSALQSASARSHVRLSVFGKGEDAVIEVFGDGRQSRGGGRGQTAPTAGATSEEPQSYSYDRVGSYLVNGIAEAHGGHFTVRTLPNGGTIHAIEIPLDQP